MKPTPAVSGALGAALTLSLLAFSSTTEAQSLLNESGTATLAPTLTPTGGYAANPQEYLMVQWWVTESPSLVYTYAYIISNPAGDVLLTPTGGLTSTPEIFDAFSLDFNTTVSGAYIPGSQTGGAFHAVNQFDLAWFFSPAIPNGSSAPMISFQSDLPPALGNANAQDDVPPSPWSTIAPGGQQIPVPTAPLQTPVPEPSTYALLSIISAAGVGLRLTRDWRR